MPLPMPSLQDSNKAEYISEFYEKLMVRNTFIKYKWNESARVKLPRMKEQIRSQRAKDIFVYGNKKGKHA